MTAIDEQQRRLLRIKLGALVRARGAELGELVDLGTSVAGVADGRAWVLGSSNGPGTLAAALLFAERSGVDGVVLFVDEGAEALTRLGGYFRVGDGEVEVRRVVHADSETVPAAPLAPLDAAPEAPTELLALLEQRQLELCVERGEITAEVLGLEVARLVRWPVEVGGDGALHLEAGVGRFDRDAVASTHADLPPEVALDRAVDMVRAHRRPGAAVHPIGLLARERWLRRTVLADPALVGAAQLHPVEMTTTRAGLKDAHPAAALGVDLEGRPVLVVCSTGVDLSLVPLAADTRALHEPDAALVLALADRDRHPATERLSSMLVSPASVVAVAPEWA